MGSRLSKIYTKTGDDGSTGLGDGSRIAKDAARVEAYGTVDELNSCLGVLLACNTVPASLHAKLLHIQHELFDLGGELSIPTLVSIRAKHVSQLEQWLDELNANLPPLKEFILPGGGQAAAACHLARTICRRAERRLVTLSKQEQINSSSLIYLNRLSDLLFVIARVLARAESGQEVLWCHDRKK